MTKSLIIKWLESTKKDQIDSINAAKQQAKKELFEQQIKPFMPLIEKIVPALLAAEKLEDALISNAREAGYNFYANFRVTSNLSENTRTIAKYKKIAIHYILHNSKGGDNKALDKLLSQYENAANEVNENYIALVSNVRICKSAKDAIDYLTSLRLDLTDLYTYSQEMVPHSLALPVNLDVLGLKTNKSQEDSI